MAAGSSASVAPAAVTPAAASAGGSCVGGRGSGGRHPKEPLRLPRTRSPGLTPRRHGNGVERRRAGRAPSRHCLCGVRRRSAEEGPARLRGRVAHQQGAA